MTHHRVRRARIWRAALVAGIAAVALVATATPAHAWHWKTTTQSYQATSPYDPGGADAYVRIGNAYDSGIYGSARFDAYDERLRVWYSAGTEMTYRIQAPPGVTIARGTVPVPPNWWKGCALSWGYSGYGPCWRTRAGANVREGTVVAIRICIWLDLHWSWYCATAKGRA